MSMPWDQMGLLRGALSLDGDHGSAGVLVAATFQLVEVVERKIKRVDLPSWEMEQLVNIVSVSWGEPHRTEFLNSEAVPITQDMLVRATWARNRDVICKILDQAPSDLIFNTELAFYARFMAPQYLHLFLKLIKRNIGENRITDSSDAPKYSNNGEVQTTCIS
ncbi:hypothetical protein BDV19DRAFT_395325 [Aspergillus venezuelensis]